MSRTRLAVCLLSLTMLAPIHPAGADESRTVDLGTQIEDFSLRDSYGRPRALSDYDEDTKLIVVAFLGTECPLVKLYSPRLEKLRSQYADRGVVFLGINSNVQDTMTEIAGYVQRYDIGFPILKDPGNRVADQFGAERTPEVYILDAERKVRYRGRIDDQYGIGYQRAEPRRQDLVVALDELLDGKQVSLADTESVGCHIGRVENKQPRGTITYASHMADIINRRCVECHREGEIAPFPLSTYEDIAGWGETILEVIDEQRMPPWNANPAHGRFRNDARLTDVEKQLFRQWVDNGMPAGDLSQSPPPPSFPVGWRMAEPDEIVHMRDKPFSVPAEGTVEYQYFTVDPGFEEDKYVTSAECRPDNRAVVHHIIVYIWPPEQRRFREEGAIVGYAPGSPPLELEDGLAVKVPAGSKLVFEMHYTPNGSEQLDRSYVGLKFTDKANVRKLIEGEMAINTSFRIPPGESEHKVVAQRKIRRDLMLLSMTPHMHLRGKSFRYEARYPNGDSEILLDVPHYDFNWQLTYELEEPKLLPKGSRIYCTAYFDNSEDNPANPDPAESVQWGDQSWEEMMIGFFDVVEADKDDIDGAAAVGETAATAPTVDPSGVWRWDHEENGKTVHNVLKLELDGDTVQGVYQGDDEPYKIEGGKVVGDALQFHMTFPYRNNQELVVAFEGRLAGDELEGTVSFEVGENSLDLPWRATRDASGS